MNLPKFPQLVFSYEKGNMKQQYLTQPNFDILIPWHVPLLCTSISSISNQNYFSTTMWSVWAFAVADASVRIMAFNCWNLLCFAFCTKCRITKDINERTSKLLNCAFLWAKCVFKSYHEMKCHKLSKCQLIREQIKRVCI